MSSTFWLNSFIMIVTALSELGDGLIFRKPDPDGARKKQVIATEKGKGMLDDTKNDMQTLEEDLTHGISKKGLDTFYQVIKTMVGNLS